MNRTTDPAAKSVGFEFVEQTLTPEQQERMKAAFDRHARNMAWFEAHADEVRHAYPGRYVAIVSGRVVAAEDPKALYARVRDEHGVEGEGAYVRYIRPHPAEQL